MSYTKKIGDKEYEFASEKAYDTYYKLATSAAKQNGITIREALEGNYQKYVDANSPLIGAKKEETVQTVVPQYSDYSGLLDYADAYKSSAYANASALRGASYEAALKARQESEALAEIQRKRGIVDASTMAEQQKATYGANAEQLGRMGLNVSGYSDYLNSQAYATGMAYRQAANAQATDIKRQATYQEALARLEADKAYSQATAEADKTYYGAMTEIEAAKIADAKALEERLYKEQQQKEAQQQTNYLKMLELAASGVDVSEVAKNFGLTEEQITSIGNATPTVEGDLSETKYNNLYNSYVNQEASGDYVGAAFTRTEMENYTASEEQKQIISANNVIADVDRIMGSDSQLEALATNIKSGKYGNASESIKEAYSEKILANTSTMTRADFEDILNSEVNKTLLTEKARKTLQADFEKRYSSTVSKNEINIYSSDFDMSDFGTFIGSEKDNSKQSAYTSALKKLIESGTLVEGDVIIAKYGEKLDSWSRRGVYVYDGKGGFKKANKSFSYDKIRVPDGYVYSALEVKLK